MDRYDVPDGLDGHRYSRRYSHDQYLAPLSAEEDQVPSRRRRRSKSDCMKHRSHSTGREHRSDDRLSHQVKTKGEYTHVKSSRRSQSQGYRNQNRGSDNERTHRGAADEEVEADDEDEDYDSVDWDLTSSVVGYKSPGPEANKREVSRQTEYGKHLHRYNRLLAHQMLSESQANIATGQRHLIMSDRPPGAPSPHGSTHRDHSEHIMTSHSGFYGTLNYGFYRSPNYNFNSTPNYGPNSTPHYSFYGVPSNGSYSTPNSGFYGTPSSGTYGISNSHFYSTQNSAFYGTPNFGHYGIPEQHTKPIAPQMMYRHQLPNVRLQKTIMSRKEGHDEPSSSYQAPQRPYPVSKPAKYVSHQVGTTDHHPGHVQAVNYGHEMSSSKLRQQSNKPTRPTYSPSRSFTEARAHSYQDNLPSNPGPRLRTIETSAEAQVPSNLSKNSAFPISPGYSKSEPENNKIGSKLGSGSLNTSTSVLSLPSSVTLGPKHYHYSPLEGVEFRLLKILPERMSKLRCEIVHQSLEHPPDYIAISYAWGDGLDTKSLMLHGKPIPVAASLYDALKAVRQKRAESLVWADALCINQQDKLERATQVRLMGHIYSRAMSVAIWLGPEADESTLAIQLLERVARNVVSPRRIRAIRKYADSAALFELFKRDYWKRLWVS
jgi:hypothetical protein